MLDEQNNLERGTAFLDEHIQTKSEEEAILNELAALSPLEYEKIRKEKAKELGCRESILDKLVSQHRKELMPTNDSAGQLITFADVDLWSEPVDGAELLTKITKTIKQFIVCDIEVLPPITPDQARRRKSIHRYNTHYTASSLVFTRYVTVHSESI